MKKMKKLIIPFFALLTVFSVSAQFSVSGSVYRHLVPNNDSTFVFVVNGINNATELSYNLPYTTINWYRYSNPTASISNLNHIFPDAGGYFAVIDGKRNLIWIIDYQEHLPELIEFEPIFEESDCEKTYFRLNENAVSRMEYRTFDNAVRYIDRKFTITYNTREYNDGVWGLVEKTEEITLPSPRISVPASLHANAIFTLSGDQIADAFNINPKFSASSNQMAITAIESRLTAVVTVREATNEVSRPRENEVTPPNQVTGSAPIDINFQSRPSDDGAIVQWRIYRDGESTPLVTRNDLNTRYTFTSFGKYKVKLLVTNGDCTHNDSITIDVRESWLSVPNVFTPNGDGINDEFRVAFRSLASFHIWVYTDSGQLVYESTDPRRGWDGRIGNRNAPMGTYFYIIRARGTDGVNWNKKGDVSIIR
jgi:gliding motility-associated-like protein